MKHNLSQGFRRTGTTFVAMICAVSVAISGAAAAGAAPADAETLAGAQIESLLGEALIAADAVVEEQLIAPSIDGAIEFATDNGSVTVEDSADGLALEFDGGTGLGLPLEATASDAQVLADGTALFREERVDLAVQAHEDGSVRAQTVIWDSSSPDEYVYDLQLPDGVQVQLADDGGVDVLQTFDGESGSILTSRFEPAWAVDANGKPLPTWYELQDGALVQVVRHGEGTAYPVVADPFWISAIIVGIRVAAVVLKVGSKTVKYAKAPASRVVNALSSFQTLSFRTGSHIFKLDKSAMKHILERHHPNYCNGTTKSTQTFFNPNMSVNDVRNLIHGAMKQWPATLKSRGTNTRIQLDGTYDNVKYRLVIDKGRVVQFYPR